MERYEIWKNGRLFAGFQEGDTSRFGVPFCRGIALREFDSCMGYWESRHGTSTWELRMIIPPPDPTNQSLTRISKPAFPQYYNPMEGMPV